MSTPQIDKKIRQSLILKRRDSYEQKLPVSPLFLTKMATWVILLAISNPAFCERGGVIFGFTMGFFSRTGLIVGYGLTDKLLIEAHLGASGCGTGVVSTTWGISAKYRPIPDNEKFYLLAGWTKVGDPSSGYPRLTDNQGNRYITKGYSSGLNLGLGREFSINQEVGLAKHLFWAVEGGLYLSLKDEHWRITLKDGEQVISTEEERFFWRRSPFFNTGPIFYSKRD